MDIGEFLFLKYAALHIWDVFRFPSNFSLELLSHYIFPCWVSKTDHYVSMFFWKGLRNASQSLQWKLDITYGQRSGNLFAITRFCYIEVLSIYFTTPGAKYIVLLRTLLYRSSFYRGSTENVYWNKYDERRKSWTVKQILTNSAKYQEVNKRRQ